MDYTIYGIIFLLLLHAAAVGYKWYKIPKVKTDVFAISEKTKQLEIDTGSSIEKFIATVERNAIIQWNEEHKYSEEYTSHELCEPLNCKANHRFIGYSTHDKCPNPPTPYKKNYWRHISA